MYIVSCFYVTLLLRTRLTSIRDLHPILFSPGFSYLFFHHNQRKKNDGVMFEKQKREARLRAVATGAATTLPRQVAIGRYGHLRFLPNATQFTPFGQKSFLRRPVTRQRR